MNDYVAEAWELAAQARAMPPGPGQVAIWEAAIAHADRHADEPLGFELRSEATWWFPAAGRSDLLLVHYSRCLSHLDRHPGRPAAPVLNRQWSVMNYMCHFADISREQMDAVWRDTLARVTAAGYAPRVCWVVREMVARFWGDRPEAVAARAAARRAADTEDALSLRPSSVGRLEVLHQLFLGRDDIALAAARPFLDGTSSVEHDTIFALSSSLLALARAGRATEARAAHGRAQALAAGRPLYVAESQATLTFQAVTGDWAGAGRHFDRLFPLVATRPGELGRIHAYRHALFFARGLVRRDRKPRLKVPEGLIPGVVGGRATPGQLRDWLEVEVPALSARADARHGNGYYTDRLADLDDYAALARRLA